MAEFADAALGCHHPFENVVCPASVFEHLPFRVGTSTAEVAQFRLAVLDKWRRRALLLEPQERRLHSEMNPSVEAIMGTKKLLIFREMLEEAGFPNAKRLVDYMATGFPLAGLFPQTGVLPLLLGRLPVLFKTCGVQRLLPGHALLLPAGLPATLTLTAISTTAPFLKLLVVGFLDLFLLTLFLLWAPGSLRGGLASSSATSFEQLTTSPPAV